MSRLPQPGSDDGTWGTVLNDFLVQAHNADGSLKQLNQSQITDLVSDLAAKASAAYVDTQVSGLNDDLATKADTSYVDAQISSLSGQVAGKVAGGNGINAIVKLTQVQYDALATKDSATLYVIE